MRRILCGRLHVLPDGVRRKLHALFRQAGIKVGEHAEHAVVPGFHSPCASDFVEVLVVAARQLSATSLEDILGGGRGAEGQPTGTLRFAHHVAIKVGCRIDGALACRVERLLVLRSSYDAVFKNGPLLLACLRQDGRELRGRNDARPRRNVACIGGA